MARRDAAHHRALVFAVIAALALSLAPSHWTSFWIDWFREPVTFLFRPIAHPLTSVSRSIRPARGAAEESPRLAELQRERDAQTLVNRRLQRRIEELEATIEQLQQGVPAAPAAPIRQIAAPVTGGSSDPADGVMQVGAGRRQGVVPGATVAVARAVNLVGRVIEVDQRSCWVLPITTRPRGEGEHGWIEGRVEVGDDLASSFRCQVRPMGDGTLAGDVVRDAVGVEAGQIVRLDDPAWPASAQMLILGAIERVERKENQRLVITVRPAVAIDRVSDVVLRVTLAAREEVEP